MLHCWKRAFRIIALYRKTWSPVLAVSLLFGSFFYYTHIYIERERISCQCIERVFQEKPVKGPVGIGPGENPFLDILRNRSVFTSRESFCPCCGFAGALSDVFHTDSKSSRSNAECPVCGARERHRLACLGLSKEIVPSTQRILHFGPQVKMESQIQEIRSIDQISMDFFQQTKTGNYRYSKRTVFGDVTKIPLPDEFVDLIIILHVLEHVPDVEKGLRELNRVLHATGALIVEVPCSPSSADNRFCGLNSTPEERIQCSGQNDHFWIYSCSGFFKLVSNASFTCVPMQCSERNLLGEVTLGINENFEIKDPQRQGKPVEIHCNQIHHIGVQALCHKIKHA